MVMSETLRNAINEFLTALENQPKEKQVEIAFNAFMTLYDNGYNDGASAAANDILN